MFVRMIWPLSLLAAVAGCSSDAPEPGGSGGHTNSAGHASLGGYINFGGSANLGGSWGVGGNPSTGGAALARGGASSATSTACSACARAQACCLALAEVQFAHPDPCYTFTTNCDSFTGEAQAAIIAACHAYLADQAANGLPACQAQ